MTDSYSQALFLHHRVRNMLRRGWMEKIYNDGKLLKGRIKTAEHIENDDIDILFPVGLVAHVKPSEKTEAFTMDVGGDPSRRVIMNMIGDRDQHPAPDENEIFLYAPGDKQIFTRMKTQRDAQQRSNDNSGRTKESGREAGIHSDGKDLDVSSTTKATNSTNADKGIGSSTQGNFTARAGGNVQTEGAKLIGVGESHNKGPMYVEGVVHAGNVYAGGGTDVSSSSARAREDGSQSWGATGRPGLTGLLEIAQRVGVIEQLIPGGGGDALAQLTQAVQQLTETVQQLTSRVEDLEAARG